MEREARTQDGYCWAVRGRGAGLVPCSDLVFVSGRNYFLFPLFRSLLPFLTCVFKIGEGVLSCS